MTLLDTNTVLTIPDSRPPEIDYLSREDFFPAVDNSPPLSVVPRMVADMDNTLSNRIPMVDVRTLITNVPQPPDPIFTDLFDRGDKIALIGGSKTRKTFFLLQLALSLAAGRKFLQWDVPAPLKILFLQMEVKSSHFHKRVFRMAQALDIPADEILNFHLLNGRGYEFEIPDLLKRVNEVGADLIILDPLYKLHDGDENFAKDVKPLLAAFDALAKKTGAAVLYCHHDPKGNSGDRSNRDRGAGSNVLGRDYDCGIFLTEHRSEEGAVVVDALLRNYPPVNPFSVRFSDYHFAVDEALEPVVATAKSDANRKQRGPSLSALVEKAADMLVVPMQKDVFRVMVQEKHDIGAHKARDVIRLLLDLDKFEQATVKSFPCKQLIGPAGKTKKEAIRLTQKWREGDELEL